MGFIFKRVPTWRRRSMYTKLIYTCWFRYGLVPRCIIVRMQREKTPREKIFSGSWFSMYSKGSILSVDDVRIRYLFTNQQQVSSANYITFLSSQILMKFWKYCQDHSTEACLLPCCLPTTPANEPHYFVLKESLLNDDDVCPKIRFDQCLSLCTKIR